jgi:hypothetical protein
MNPTRWWPNWSASAARPAHCGEPALVPPNWNTRLAPWPDELHTASTPPLMAALYEMSGTPRLGRRNRRW